MEITPFIDRARKTSITVDDAYKRLEFMGITKFEYKNITDAVENINKIREASNSYAINAVKSLLDRRQDDIQLINEKQRKATEYAEFAGRYYYENRDESPVGSEMVYFDEARRFVDRANELRIEAMQEEKLENDFGYLQALNTAVDLLKIEVDALTTIIEKEMKKYGGAPKRGTADFTRVNAKENQGIIIYKDSLDETEGGLRLLQEDARDRIEVLQKSKVPQDVIRVKTASLQEWGRIKKNVQPPNPKPIQNLDKSIKNLQEKIDKYVEEQPVIDAFSLSEKYGGDLFDRMETTRCQPRLKIKDGRIDYDTYERLRDERKYDHTYARDSFIREKAYARREYRQIMEEHAFDITNITSDYQKMETNDGSKMVRVISLYPDAYTYRNIRFDDQGRIVKTFDGPYGRIEMTPDDEDIYLTVAEEIQKAFNEWILYANTLYYQSDTEKYLPYIKLAKMEGHLLKTRILYKPGEPGIMFEINMNLARADFEQFVARQVTKYVAYYFIHIIFGNTEDLHNRYWIALMRSLMNHGVAQKYYKELGRSFRPLKETDIMYDECKNCWK